MIVYEHFVYMWGHVACRHKPLEAASDREAYCSEAGVHRKVMM